MLNKWVDGSMVRGYGDIAQLVLRVALGIVFAWHGYAKIFNTGMQGVAGFLGSVGIPIPEIMAYILAYGELISGICLIIGLFTYLAAKFAIVVAIVAFFTVHLPNGFNVANGGYEFIMLIFAAAIAVLVMGPGKHSADVTWRHKPAGGM